MATGSEILSYQGNAELGLGSNPDIPVSSNKDLDLINQTSRDIYLNNIARNKQMFDLKVKDRDQLLQALDEGEIKTGDLLNGDEPWVRESLDKMDEAFDNWTKKGVRDIDAARAYKKAKRDAQERTTQAQMRKLAFDKENQQLASDKLPRTQAARKAHIDNMVNGDKWADITPYQQTLDLDFDPIKAYAKPTTTEVSDPRRPLYKGKRTYIDFAPTQAEATKDFLENNDVRENQVGLFNEYQKLPAQRAYQDYGAIQRRLMEYNKQRGFKPGDKNFVELKIATNPDGSPLLKDNHLVLNESVPDFAAKWAIAQQPLFQTEAFELDKNATAYELGKERNRIAGLNATANMTRAKAYGDLQKKKLSSMTDNEKQIKGFWDGVVDRVGEMQLKGGGKADYLLRGNLPEGYTYMAGVDAKGQPVALKPKITKRADGSQFEYYETRYNNGSTGDQVNKNFLNGKYDAYKKAGGAGDYNSYLRNLIKQGVIDLEIVGQNGTADFNTALQSARALSNKVGAGKEEPVFSETEQVIEE